MAVNCQGTVISVPSVVPMKAIVWCLSVVVIIDVGRASCHSAIADDVIPLAMLHFG